MRRAVSLTFLLALACAMSPAPGFGQSVVKLVNGIGLIDYMHAPRFKVGDWVTYRTTGESELGMTDDYTVTVLISGEERFWGEDCFWVETWTERSGSGAPAAVATLMSYSIFGDSLWLQNLKLYMRKTVTEVSEDGRPLAQLLKRPSEFQKRDVQKRDISVARDTLGADTVMTPKGTFDVVKFALRQGIGANAEMGDSTVRTEVREDHTVYYSSKIPITGIAREDIESSQRRKAWKVGQSQDVPLHTVERAVAVARLIDFGSGGLTPSMTPEYARKPMARAAPATSKAKPAVRKRTG
jgi:hypothetical protein